MWHLSGHMIWHFYGNHDFEVLFKFLFLVFKFDFVIIYPIPFTFLVSLYFPWFLNPFWSNSNLFKTFLKPKMMNPRWQTSLAFSDVMVDKWLWQCMMMMMMYTSHIPVVLIYYFNLLIINNCFFSLYNCYLAIKPSSNPLLFPCGNLRRETIPSEMTKAGER